MNKHLPIVVFAICIVIAVILAATMFPLWPAALAIALSGGALAMALRPQPASELAYLVDDMTVMQEQNAELRGQIEKNSEMLEELADVVEQIASLAADGGDVTQVQFDALRAELADIQLHASQKPQIDEFAKRLAALEKRTADLDSASDSALGLTDGGSMVTAAAASALASRTDAIEARLGMLELQSSDADRVQESTAIEQEHPAASAGAPVVEAAMLASDNGALRSLIAQGNGPAPDTTEQDVTTEQDAAESFPEPDPVDPTPMTDGAQTTLAPIFLPELGAPVAFLLRPAESDSPESIHSVLRHAIKITNELEEAGREVLLFVWLDPSILGLPEIRDDILAAIRTEPALQRRLTMLTRQEGFDVSTQTTLAAIAEEGCKFGLDSVQDWSLNLAALARDGLSYILVDGPAMATAAQDQGGDARRLAQALGMHDIKLIGGSVASKHDIDSVNTLEPTLMTGEGLGEARVLEVHA